jgi:hypothetical protein
MTFNSGRLIKTFFPAPALHLNGRPHNPGKVKSQPEKLSYFNVDSMPASRPFLQQLARGYATRQSSRGRLGGALSLDHVICPDVQTLLQEPLMINAVHVVPPALSRPFTV